MAYLPKESHDNLSTKDRNYIMNLLWENSLTLGWWKTELLSKHKMIVVFLTGIKVKWNKLHYLIKHFVTYGHCPRGTANLLVHFPSSDSYKFGHSQIYFWQEENALHKGKKEWPEMGEREDLRILFLKCKMTTKNMQCGCVYVYVSA